MTPVFVDTNVFLYAAGAAHPLRRACQAVLRAIGEGTLEATTSAEVVQEIVYVLGRRGRREDALRLARGVLGLFPGVLPVTREVLSRALDLIERHPELPARDAVHAATMEQHGIRRIVTADRHFDALAGIERVDPGAWGE